MGIIKLENNEPNFGRLKKVNKQLSTSDCMFKKMYWASSLSVVNVNAAQAGNLSSNQS